MKKWNEKILMLFVLMLDEVVVVVSVGIYMVFIEGKYFDVEMCEVVGDCFV